MLHEETAAITIAACANWSRLHGSPGVTVPQRRGTRACTKSEGTVHIHQSPATVSAERHRPHQSSTLPRTGKRPGGRTQNSQPVLPAWRRTKSADDTSLHCAGAGGTVGHGYRLA